MTLNPLANPKGVKLQCELCQKPAYYQCTTCRVTYYCSKEHLSIDYSGIHDKICSLLVGLRAPAPMVSSEEERQHRKEQLLQRQKQLIDITRTEGSKLLFEGEHEAAVPAALQALRFSIDVYGLNSIELVPAYLVLGEASIGLGRLNQAEEYLSQAQWTVLKTPDSNDVIKSKMYRIYGLLQAAKGNFSEALKHYANDIYHVSLAVGPRHIKTSGGYFHMANVFFRRGEVKTAHSIYTEVVSIWNDMLVNGVELQDDLQEKTLTSVLDESSKKAEILDEAQEAEAIQVLHAIYDLELANDAYPPRDMITLLQTMAILHYHLMNFTKASDFVAQAIGLIERLDLSVDVAPLQQLQMAIQRNLEKNVSSQKLATGVSQVLDNSTG